MAFRKSVQNEGPQVWTVAELGAFYTVHSFELQAHANRLLKNSAKAEEVVQDALIKVMLAAPELSSEEHALSYLHRTIENLCIDIFRVEGRRPNLVVLDDATAERVPADATAKNLRLFISFFFMFSSNSLSIFLIKKSNLISNKKAIKSRLQKRKRIRNFSSKINKLNHWLCYFSHCPCQPKKQCHF